MKKIEKQKSTKTERLEQLQKNERKTQRLLTQYRSQNTTMQWLMVVVIVLLLLFALTGGYATDWGRGFKNASSNTPIQTDNGADGAKSSKTNSSKKDEGTASQDQQSTQADATSSSTPTTNTSASKESTSSTHSTSTTTNNSSNTSTTTTTTTSPDGLVTLYGGLGTGQDISVALSRAQVLGISNECHNEVLIQVCEFRQGDRIVTTKNLLGTGLITSIVKNF